MLPLLLFSLYVVPAFAATADQWRNRTIYQVLTDRFATSDNSSPRCNTTAAQYCGGTWRGIINRIDYIKDLGFDAIWISPVNANIEGNTAYGEAYHGYWSQDLNSLNPHFGNASDLRELSDELHRRDMLLMVDVVVNHMASAINPPNFAAFQPFSSSSFFHPQCYVTDYNNQSNVEQCWLGDSNLSLVDLNTENQVVVDTLNNWIKALAVNYTIDGIRIDTVKHIRKDFWTGFAQAAGVFTLGEVWSENTTYVADYTQVVDGVLDYPTWFSLVPAFSNTTGNITDLAVKVWDSQARYRTGEFLVGSFLDNHDNPRFMSFVKDHALIRNAMAWPFVQDGIPILYQGQEQSFTGGRDPLNREAMWLSGYVEQKALVTDVKLYNAARRAAMAHNADFLKTAAKLYAVSQHTVAVSKPPLLALLSNLGNTSTPNWNVPGAGYKPGETLVDVLTCNKVVADDKGGVLVTGKAGNPQILLPVTALDPKGRMCSNMATPGPNGSASNTGRGGNGVTRQASSATAATSGEDLRTQVLWALSIALPFTLLFLASQTSLFLG
ncbi:ATP-binding cassette transporter [Ganoderma sinense ZZ0214-1]|uniref:alpha-amylase n=1 Tax=Ganoderma sinense ZZ0214-1 TaxID=1077348 RepID=A0A2G8RXY6_9APHY|nr:ATP-binding cassette transporter [Ganoderma sinense ZZ0214-1]